MSTDWDKLITEHYDEGREEKLTLDFLMESVRPC